MSIKLEPELDFDAYYEACLGECAVFHNKSTATLH